MDSRLVLAVVPLSQERVSDQRGRGPGFARFCVAKRRVVAAEDHSCSVQARRTASQPPPSSGSRSTRWPYIVYQGQWSSGVCDS